MGLDNCFPLDMKEQFGSAWKYQKWTKLGGMKSHCLADQSLGTGDSARRVGMARAMSAKALCESLLCSAVSADEEPVAFPPLKLGLQIYGI